MIFLYVMAMKVDLNENCNAAFLHLFFYTDTKYCILYLFMLTIFVYRINPHKWLPFVLSKCFVLVAGECGIDDIS